jgi:chromosome segregation ATPase
MSKTKIVEAHREALAALRELDLPAEAAPSLKQLDRAFLELRGLHTETERDRQEWCRLVAEREESLKDAVRQSEQARAKIGSLERQVSSLASHLVDRLTGRESKPKFEAELASLQHKMRRLAFEFVENNPDLASQMASSVMTLVESMTDHIDKMFRIYEQGIATYMYLLCLACHQYGPLKLTERPPDGVLSVDLQLHREGSEWSLRVREVRE